MTPIEEYYNKFNEDKRLNTRHGQVEFITSMHYIHKYLDLRKQQAPENTTISILDIGAGTGRYAIPLSEEGYEVSAVELVKHNLSRMQKNGPRVKARQGNALDLHKYPDNSFDLTLLFGPMYHLHSEEEKSQALAEALRVTKPEGYVLVAYIMNEYAVLTYAFREKHILENLNKEALSRDFHCLENGNSLYSYVRLEDINRLNCKNHAKRRQIIAADGAANYMRRELNALSEEEFACFLKYHLATCERQDLLGASAHTVDIVQKNETNP